MSHVRLVAPFGFYGWGNIGDEGTLQGFGRTMSQMNGEIEVWVASRNPAHTARTEPSFKYFSAEGVDLRRWWANSRAEGYVFAGGTPIADGLGMWPLREVASLVASAQEKSLPVIFLGIGVETLVRQETRSLFAERLRQYVQHWSVRSSRDRFRLEASGVPPDRITVGADMAWLLDPVSSSFGRNYLAQLGLDLQSIFIGVNVNCEKFMVKQCPEMFEYIGALLDRLVEEKGVRVLFFCADIRQSETFDKAAAQKVMDRMKHRSSAFLVPNEYWTPQQMLSLISLCRFTISTRYHFCVFSAIQGVPFVALARSEKIEDLCRDLNWPNCVALTDMVDSSLFDKISAMDENRARSSEDLSARCTVLRQCAAKNVILMEKYIASVRERSLR